MQIRTAHYFQYSFFYANKSEDLLVNLFWLLENLWKSDLKESIIPGWKSNILKCHLECLHIISNSSTYFYSLITSKFPELWFWQVNLVYSEVNWSLSFCSRKHNTGYKIPDKIGLTYTICIFFKCIFFCEDWCKPRVQVCYIKLYLRGKKKIWIEDTFRCSANAVFIVMPTVTGVCMVHWSHNVTGLAFCPMKSKHRNLGHVAHNPLTSCVSAHQTSSALAQLLRKCEERAPPLSFEVSKLW